MDMTVGQVARMSGVTVRTLHHYDAIGLVAPATRSEAGYRLYGHEDVARLQEVLFFRELGFALDEIATIVSDPGYDRRRALERQRGLLEKRADHTLRMMENTTGRNVFDSQPVKRGQDQP